MPTLRRSIGCVLLLSSCGRANFDQRGDASTDSVSPRQSWVQSIGALGQLAVDADGNIAVAGVYNGTIDFAGAY